MAKKKRKSTFKEKTIALKDVENLTVEQIAAQSDTLASENKDKESTLDRYIRQHRSEIESAKRDRHSKTVEAVNALDQFVRTAREDTNTQVPDQSGVDNNLGVSEVSVSDSSLDVSEAPVSDNNLDISDAPVSESSLDESDASVSEGSLDTSDTSVVDSHTDATDTPLVDSDTKDNDGADSAHHIAAESVKVLDTSQEIDPVFPEIQGSFDTVLLAADDATVSAASIASETAEEVPVSAVSETKSDTFSEVSTVSPLIIEDNTGLDAALAEDQLSEQLEPIAASETAVAEPKKNKKPVIIGICALILLAAGGLVWANINQSKQKEADKTSQSSQKKSEEAKATKAFDQQYAGFFTDDKQTKLKNDQFAKIGELVSAVDKLKANADYQSLKKKVDSLKTEISVTEAMNANFDKAIIVDGVLDKTAVVKDGVKLSYTATENDGLNSLLKEAIAHGQAQQAEKAKSAAAASAVTPAVTPTTPNTTTNRASQSDGTTNQAAGSTNQANTGANQSTAPVTNGGGASAGYGLTTAQYQSQYPAITLETGRSRVPVDPNANLNDAAFVWASGIRELVLQKCRDRGYITGDAYILLPASIQKGNGYYNLYKTDGTYLVSINCKTGYFVGNAAGHADNLDY
ncbi:hypothetical protein GYN67_01475 [Lactococcus piscium]|uniref:cell division site-positioning protein MapZ family protein n=1 Tax=Pseudolactococcus carnosus TaxID=2749961 RepID=UPI001FB9C898|nr:cell division site-positioning protein MapZ family protein [Lactococcus carnosus]MCJ1995361.1 hypothetical protein [Lactococcus carnosus]